MADYYPLIARAVEGLADRSPEMRRAVYARARAALLGQLESLDPPLSREDIETERVALDAAIARIEAEHGVPKAAPASEPVRPSAARPAPGREPARETAPVIPLQERAREAPPSPPPGREGAERDVPPPRSAAAKPTPREPAPTPPGPTLPGPTREGETLPPAGLPPAVTAPTVAAPPEDDFAPPPPEPPVRPRIDSRSPVAVRSGRGRSVALAAVLALVILPIAVAAFILRDRPGDPPRPGPVAQGPQAPADGAKLGERVGGGSAPPLPAPAAPPGGRADPSIAQRAVLFEEDPSNPQTPRATGGRVVWKLDAVEAGQGQPLQSAIRATVDVPETGFSLNLLVRRNLDPTLPASHTVELAFATKAGEAGRAIRDVGLLQFKTDVGGRGTPVAGLPVPVRDNLFLIGLSNLPGDIERNTELIKGRSWIDLPIRMASGQRAIVSFEKGAAGEQVVRDAFQSWQ